MRPVGRDSDLEEHPLQTITDAGLKTKHYHVPLLSIAGIDAFG